MAIAEGLTTREELWVTSKLWNTYHAAEHVRLAAEKTLSDLRLDYLDLSAPHTCSRVAKVGISWRE